MLTSLVEGDKNLYVNVKPGVLKLFDAVVSGLAIDHNEQLQVPSIINHLVSVHSTKGLANLDNHVLELLVTSHAAIRFSSEAPLTRDAFCRALLLLTHRGESNHKQQMGIGVDLIIRKNAPERHLGFIYSALASPPTGAVVHDDVVDTLLRVAYPMHVLAKPKEVQRRRRVKDLSMVAEGLKSSGGKTASKVVSGSVVRPLERLALAFPSQWDGTESRVSSEDQHEVSPEEFVKWALEVGYPYDNFRSHRWLMADQLTRHAGSGVRCFLCWVVKVVVISCSLTMPAFLVDINAIRPRINVKGQQETQRGVPQLCLVEPGASRVAAVQRPGSS